MVARRAGDERLASRAEQVAARTYELSELLVDLLGVEDVGAYFPHRVTYHPTCHSLLTLRPDLHICVVRVDQIVATVPEAIAGLAANRPLTWISGPVGHQRHRTEPDRRRPRSTHPARRHHRQGHLPRPRITGRTIGVTHDAAT
jgi:hypothetical protein